MPAEVVTPVTLPEQRLQIEGLRSWQEVPELAEPRTQEFKDLRGEVLETTLHERTGRLMLDPEKTPEEEAVGVIREWIEPQCRDAIFSMSAKGHKTYNSGFGTGNTQVVDGDFTGISQETVDTLQDKGYLVFETQPGNVSIGFKPEEPNLAQMTERWDTLAEILPDKGHVATTNSAVKEAYYADAQTPGTYTHEMAMRLEDLQEVNQSEPEAELPEGVVPELVMKETDPAIIDRQVEQGLQEQGTFRFLNNFEHHLPNGWDKVNLEKYPELEDVLAIDPCYTQEDIEDGYAKPWPTDSDRAYRSEKYLSSTNSQYCADVLQAVNNAESKDFNGQRLEELRQAYVAKREASRIRSAPEEREAYLTYALPVYKAMRQMGYSHYDLWA